MIRKHLDLSTAGLICSLAIALTGCSKTESPAGQSLPHPIEPCSLLTSDEVKSVQGEAVQSTKPSTNTGPDFIVSQCYFTTATPVNSVVVTITQKGTGGGRSLKEFWKETFGEKNESEEAREKREKREKKGEREEEREGPKPERVDGLGDEAFWTGGRFGGALYILRNDFHIRISVGGADDLPTKLKKSKELAAIILKRLP